MKNGGHTRTDSATITWFYLCDDDNNNVATKELMSRQPTERVLWWYQRRPLVVMSNSAAREGWFPPALTRQQGGGLCLVSMRSLKARETIRDSCEINSHPGSRALLMPAAPPDTTS